MAPPNFPLLLMTTVFSIKHFWRTSVAIVLSWAATLPSQAVDIVISENTTYNNDVVDFLGPVTVESFIVKAGTTVTFSCINTAVTAWNIVIEEGATLILEGSNRGILAPSIYFGSLENPQASLITNGIITDVDGNASLTMKNGVGILDGFRMEASDGLDNIKATNIVLQNGSSLTTLPMGNITMNDLTIDLTSYKLIDVCDRGEPGQNWWTVPTTDNMQLVAFDILSNPIGFNTGSLTLVFPDDMIETLLVSSSIKLFGKVTAGAGQLETFFDDLEELTIKDKYGNIIYSGKPEIDDCGNALVTLPVIPEPSTVTLSLLALAGMAARRRRVRL